MAIDIDFDNNVINYTNITFTPKESKLLIKGPQFAPYVAYKKFWKLWSNNKDKFIIKSIQIKMNENNCATTKAGKLNVIIM